jgi:DNA-binding GntR family transcriptional regulator
MPYKTDSEMTELWCKIYEAVRQAWLDHGIAPSQTELMRACDCSNNSIQNAFKNLRKNGHVDYEKHATRSIKPTDIRMKLYRYDPNPWDTLNETKIWKD